MDKSIYSQQTELFGSAIHQTTCITGKGAPTPYIQGAVGCLYMDEDNYKTYKCVSTKDGQCVWEPGGVLADYVQGHIGELNEKLEPILLNEELEGILDGEIDLVALNEELETILEGVDE